MQEYTTRKKVETRAYLIKETNARNTTGIRFACMITYFVHLIMRPFDYTDVLVWGNPRWDNSSYYSFKIFARFWLVKTTRIIHHNQLLFTKFGKNFCHTEPMTSKWRQKCSLVAGYWTVDRENLGTRSGADYLTRLSCFGGWTKMAELSRNCRGIGQTSNFWWARSKPRLSELSSWKVRRLAQLKSSQWVWIVQHVLSVSFRRIQRLKIVSGTNVELHMRRTKLIN